MRKYRCRFINSLFLKKFLTLRNKAMTICWFRLVIFWIVSLNKIEGCIGYRSIYFRNISVLLKNRRRSLLLFYINFFLYLCILFSTSKANNPFFLPFCNLFILLLLFFFWCIFFGQCIFCVLFPTHFRKIAKLLSDP